VSSLLVLVPCRNEERVVERKLENLARCAWPRGGRHRVLVIDDHSTDATAARAAAAAERLFRARAGSPEAAVVPSAGPPGKVAAIARGLDLLRSEELVVLTDADVLFEPETLPRLAAAFADPRLGLACGAQRFVERLAADGGTDGRAPSTAGLYDRVTDLVRGLESACGMLFSVHGQCLAWRAELGLAPTPGYAADDLDLMLQARARGLRTARVPGARFHEEKRRGERREERALRRARAYVQLLAHPRLGELARLGPADRAQAWCYRRLPPAAPWLAPFGLLLLLALAWAIAGTGAALAAAALAAFAAASPPGRRCLSLLRVIAEAGRREARSPLGDSWETARR
jgi:hypothetical protein